MLRPFGIAFGCFVLLNLALALQDPRLPVTRQWLPIGLPEPGLSLFAGILGAALLRAPRRGWSGRLDTIASGGDIRRLRRTGRGRDLDLLQKAPGP